MKKHIPFIIFMVVFLALGFSIYRDYGVSWDEETLIKFGQENYQYITKGTPTIFTSALRYYGPFFETPLWRLTTKLPAPYMIYYRHLATFVVFVLCVIFLYILANRLFHHPWWSLLAAVLLVFSPRIFADSFYNTKDIPFLTFFTLAILSIVLMLDSAWKERRWIVKIGSAAFSALAGAMAIDTRMPGIVLIPLACLLMVILVVYSPKRFKEVGLILPIYLILSIGFIILFWPILWHDPFHEFIKAFVNMSHYPWNGTTLYRGQFLRPADIPWHYIPTWIAITTPLLQLGGFVIGIFCLCFVIGKGIFFKFPGSIWPFLKKITPDRLAWALIMSWFIVPLAAIMILHSTLYDAWRQMYFVYPSMLLIAVYGMKTVYGQISAAPRQVFSKVSSHFPIPFYPSASKKREDRKIWDLASFARQIPYFFFSPRPTLGAGQGVGLNKTTFVKSYALRNRTWLKIPAAVILLIGLADPVAFAIQHHPFENVYFNVFAGDPKTLRSNYDLDYWGLSYKQGIDYILAHDPSGKIKLDITDLPEMEYIQYMLAPEQAARLVPAPLDESDYFITIFRWHPQDYGYGTEYFKVDIKGMVILAVYKLK